MFSPHLTFSPVCQRVSVDNYQFILSQDTLSPSVPLDIKLEIRQASGNILPKQFADYLQSEILPIARQKSDKLSDDDKHHKIRKLGDRIESLISYLHLWYEQTMTYERYFQLRGGYQSEVQQLRDFVHEYVDNKNISKQQPITEIISQLEYKEIMKIYGGSNILNDNPSE
jgi:hypothetical protein